jgi:hypothetical protein
MAPRAHTYLPASSMFALVALLAFALYWLSALALEARDGTMHFHVDTWLYAELAEDNLFDRIVPDSQLARVFRFHPTTVVLAAGWMKIVKPLTAWITPLHLLKGMFAAVGALGVWAAMWAFAAVMPRRYVLLWAAVYATSLGVWYFSSIEESKIVTATLSGLYIATYLHLRTNWTQRGAVLLTAILLVACLNEITAGFLIIIPMVDTLIQKGRQALTNWWIALHALAGPIALATLEGVIRGWAPAAGSHPEGANHFSMFFWYLAQNEFSVNSLREFVLKWLLFNIAAPERYAYHWANPSIHFGGTFQPMLSTYLSSPIAAAVVVLLGVIVAISILAPKQSVTMPEVPGFLWGLVAYLLLRSTFFFFFNAKECLLFSASITLALLLLIGIPFTASNLPDKAKGALLLLVAALLFVNNGAFIIG